MESIVCCMLIMYLYSLSGSKYIILSNPKPWFQTFKWHTKNVASLDFWPIDRTVMLQIYAVTVLLILLFYIILLFY